MRLEIFFIVLFTFINGCNSKWLSLSIFPSMITYWFICWFLLFLVGVWRISCRPILIVIDLWVHLRRVEVRIRIIRMISHWHWHVVWVHVIIWLPIFVGGLFNRRRRLLIHHWWVIHHIVRHIIVGRIIHIVWHMLHVWWTIWRHIRWRHLHTGIWGIVACRIYLHAWLIRDVTFVWIFLLFKRYSLSIIMEDGVSKWSGLFVLNRLHSNEFFDFMPNIETRVLYWIEVFDEPVNNPFLQCLHILWFGLIWEKKNFRDRFDLLKL